MVFFLEGRIITIKRYEDETDPMFAERSSFILWFRNDPEKLRIARIASFHHSAMMFKGVSYSPQIENVVKEYRNEILRMKKEGIDFSLVKKQNEETYSKLNIRKEQLVAENKENTNSDENKPTTNMRIRLDIKLPDIRFRQPTKRGLDGGGYPNVQGYENIPAFSRGPSPYKELSPFNIGPVIYEEDGQIKQAPIFENFWQGWKVYPDVKRQNQKGKKPWVWPAEIHINSNGNPNQLWKRWHNALLEHKTSVRHPNKGGKSPLYAWWNNQKLEVVNSRKAIYIPYLQELYRKHPSYKIILNKILNGENIIILEPDGPNLVVYRDGLSLNMETLYKMQNITKLSEFPNWNGEGDPNKYVPYGHGYVLGLTMMEDILLIDKDVAAEQNIPVSDYIPPVISQPKRLDNSNSDNIQSETEQKILLFYSPKTGLGKFFSNFSDHKIEYNGKIYPTVEHFFQSMKFVHTLSTPIDLEYAELIRQQSTPNKARILANQEKKTQYPWQLELNKIIEKYSELGVKINPQWESVKVKIMYDILKLKLTQHEDVKKALLDTGDNILAENNPNDYFWGIGSDQTGQNILGRLLIELRKQLRESQS